MAVAKVVKLVEQGVAVEEYVLTLSKDEAQFVLNYIGHTVTGEVGSLRDKAYAVYKALRTTGLDYSWDFPDHIAGGIQYNHFQGIQGGY